MKKIVLVMAILFASLNLNAAKVAGPDENGRLYNTAYFDVSPVGGSPILGTISYSKRIGTYDWSKLNNQINNLKQSATFKISTRVEVPSSIETNDIYITTGKIYTFSSYNEFYYRSWKKPLYQITKWKGKRKDEQVQYLLLTKVNNKAQSSTDITLAKTKKDDFGNRYVNLTLEFTILFPTEASHLEGSKNQFVSNILPLLKEIKIKVAPKSRTYESKWVEPKIYVLDE